MPSKCARFVKQKHRNDHTARFVTGKTPEGDIIMERVTTGKSLREMARDLAAKGNNRAKQLLLNKAAAKRRHRRQ